MTRILFGDSKTGVQGIYYFDTRAEAINYASKLAPFLESLRKGTEHYKEVLDEFKNNKTLYNFLLICKDRVAEERKTPNVWWEPGGSLYGEVWKNELLPNGIGDMYLGTKLINDIEEDE